MLKLFLAMTSLFLGAAFTAAVYDLPSFFKPKNNYTEKVTETDLLEEFTTILPDVPNVNSCVYPGTCPSLSGPRNCQRCQIGYVKDPVDDTKCKYANEDENAFLLTSLFDTVTLMSLDTKNSTQIMQDRPFAYTQGVDHSFRTNKIFWFNTKDRTIYTAPLLNHTDSRKQIIMHDKLSNINGLTVDWIYNHLYWVDKQNNFVVSNFNGSTKKVLFNDGFLRAVSIVVNPLNGWMHWTDCDNQRIKRAGLDGSQKEVVLDTDIYYPRGLALDLVENRLYWSQMGGSSSIFICSSNFDGSEQKTIFTVDYSQSQFGPSDIGRIALFDKYIYLMDWFSNVFYKVNKCNGQEFEKINNSTNTLWDVKMYHSTIQPEGENLCLKQIDQCSHFCLPAPSSGRGGSVSTTTCACPDGLHLTSDRRNCVINSTILV